MSLKKEKKPTLSGYRRAQSGETGRPDGGKGGLAAVAAVEPMQGEAGASWLKMSGEPIPDSPRGIPLFGDGFGVKSLPTGS